MLSYNECMTLINMIKKNVKNEMQGFKNCEYEYISHMVAEDNQELERKKVETEVNFDLEKLNAIIDDLEELYEKYH